MKRRDFLTNAVAGLGTATVAGSLANSAARAAENASAAAKPPKNPFSTDPVARVKLFGNVETTRVGLGTGMAGYNRSSALTRMDRAQGEALIRHCYDSGIRYFDCADLYGTHEIVSTTLKDKPRDSFTLSSKIWLQPGGIPDEDVAKPVTETVERFLRELNTDYLDLVQLHCMTKPDWQTDYAKYFDDLDSLKERGLIRGHGVSCHSFGAIQTAAVEPWVDAIHIRLNTTGVRMEGTIEENLAAAKLAQENGKGIICMKIIGEGTIKDLEERRRSVDLVARCPDIDVMIVGFERIEEVDEFLDNVSRSLKAQEAERKAAGV